MVRAGEWVLLAYRLPREPSTPRVAIWRKLARLGVAQLPDGLVGLPADARTKERLEWIADEVTEAGGEATIWVGRPGSAARERALARRMAEAVAADYRTVAADVAEAVGVADRSARRRSLARLRRDLRRIATRDFFPPPEREQARRSLEALVSGRGHRGGGGGRQWELAKMVHEADLADERYDAPEAAGLDVICRGLSMVAADDQMLATTGPLFDGLYEYRRRALLLGRDPA